MKSMWVTPVFEIGLLNAWIFMLIFFFLMFIPDIVNAIRRVKGEKDFSIFPPMNKTEKRVNAAWGIIFLLGFIYSFFLPLRLDGPWFYIGLLVILLGIIIWTVVIINIISTPIGEPFTKGTYRYSRHPMFIAQVLILIGVSIITTSLIFLILSLVLISLLIITAIYEERSCLEHFGNSYREYFNKTSRWLGIPKIEK
jgi:protein-S-isoprenylcysteine O-methyltransferase Ste14